MCIRDSYADSAYFKYLRADSADIKWLRADSVDIISLRADSGYIKQLTSDSAYFKYLRADSGYISQFRSDSARIMYLNAQKLNADSASIQGQLNVGRYILDAGEWDSNDLLTDINALAQDDFGGFYYAQADSITGIREKYAHLKYDEFGKKWNFFPKLNISDLDSSGIITTTVVGADSVNAPSKNKLAYGKGDNGQFLTFDTIQNKYDWDYIVSSGLYVFDSDQLNNALLNTPSVPGSDEDKIKSLVNYKQFNFYSHGDEKYIESGGNVFTIKSGITNYTSFADHDKIKYTDISNANSYVWLDSGTNSFKTVPLENDRLNISSKLQKINRSINGAYSNKPFSSYTLEATFSAADGAKQTGAMGILIGLIKYGLTEKTLTVFRSTRATGMFDSDIDWVKDRQDNPFNFELVVNAGQADQTVINMGRMVEAPPINGNASWDSSGDVVLKVSKRNHTLTIETSQFGDSAIDVIASKRIDLFDNDGIPEEQQYLDLKEFGNAVHYGFAFDKISNAKVKDIKFSEGVEGLHQADANTIIDLKNKKTYLYFDSDKGQQFSYTKGYHNIDSDGFGFPILGGDIFTGRLYHNPELKTTWYQDPYSTFQLGQVLNTDQIPIGTQIIARGGYDADKPREILKDGDPIRRINANFITDEKGLTLTVFTTTGNIVSTKNYNIDATVDTTGATAQAMVADLATLRTGSTRNICVITSFGDWKYTETLLIAEANNNGLTKLAGSGTSAAGLSNQQYVAVYQCGSNNKLYEVAEHKISTAQPNIRFFLNEGTFFVMGGEVNSTSALTNFRGDIVAHVTGTNDVKLSSGLIAAGPSTFNSTVNISAGAANGIHFPDEAFASDADDQARIYLRFI